MRRGPHRPRGGRPSGRPTVGCRRRGRPPCLGLGKVHGEVGEAWVLPLAAKCPSRGAAGTPRFGRRGDAPPSLSERWSSASCSQVKVVRSNVNARSCVYACVLRSSAGLSWFTFAQRGATVNATRLRTHGLKSGACDRPETERQSLSARLSHDSRAAFRGFVTHNGTARPPQFDYHDPRGRCMRLVTPSRAPFASPTAPSNHGGGGVPQTLLRDRSAAHQPLEFPWRPLFALS